MEEEVLATFAEKGLLPSKEVAHWRAPASGEVVPQPQADEVISFLAFHERGLGYPAHWFLCGLLNEWGLELQHLNPTGVLHIVDFVTIYEAVYTKIWEKEHGNSKLPRLCHQGIDCIRVDIS